MECAGVDALLGGCSVVEEWLPKRGGPVLLDGLPGAPWDNHGALVCVGHNASQASTPDPSHLPLPSTPPKSSSLPEKLASLRAIALLV